MKNSLLKKTWNQKKMIVLSEAIIEKSYLHGFKNGMVWKSSRVEKLLQKDFLKKHKYKMKN